MEEDVGLKYEVNPSSQKAIARFGTLRTSGGTYNMPCVCPSVRTETDARAVTENMASQMNPQAIILHLSYKNSYFPVLSKFLGMSHDVTGIKLERPLIIPDPESEALSFNCIARSNYLKEGNIQPTVKSLLGTCLSKDDKSKGRCNATSTWNETRTKFGLTALKEWLVSKYTAVGADVFLAPTPILRTEIETIDEAFTCGYDILSQAHGDFHMSGLHLLIHGEMFVDDDVSEVARKAIYSELDRWRTTKQQNSGLFLSFKIHDPSKLLLEPSTGSETRRNLSEFITEVSERVRRAKGAVVGQNFANLALGILDSGADIASFRASGRMQIDTPCRTSGNGKKIKKDVSSVMNPGTLSMVSVSDVKKAYEKNGSYPVPSCVEPIPFWNLETKKKETHQSKMMCGVLVKVGEEYRTAGINKDIPLRESLASIVKDSEERQMLIDLCPSL